MHASEKKEKYPDLIQIRVLFWQGKKDSNPQQRFWRPTCYHYTIALQPITKRIIAFSMRLVKSEVSDSLKGSTAGGSAFQRIAGRRIFSYNKW